MRTTSEEAIAKAVEETAKSIIDDMKDDNPDREDVIQRMDEENDALFGQLVRSGQIGEYDVDDLVATAQPCALIIKVAQEDAWVEDDSGLWDGGSPYGILATIAFYSLRNLLYQAMVNAGVDSNDDNPFESLASSEPVKEP